MRGASLILVIPFFVLAACQSTEPSSYDTGGSPPQGGPQPATENTAPMLGADTLQTTINRNLEFFVQDLLANDSDKDGDTLSFIGVEAPYNGNISRQADRLVFIPVKNFVGEGGFSYVVSDGKALSWSRVKIAVIDNGNAIIDKPELAANLAEFDAVSLSWNDTTDDELAMLVFRRKLGEEFTIRLRLGPNAVSASDVDLEQGTAYEYKVVAELPNSAVKETNVVMVTSGVKTGAELYQLKCKVCHGNDGSGIPPFPPINGPATLNGLIAATANGFVRCEIEGKCAEIVSRYVFDNISNTAALRANRSVSLIKPSEYDFSPTIETRAGSVSGQIKFSAQSHRLHRIDTQYFWDFGDGHVDEGPTVEHVFTGPGEYSVMLQIYDVLRAKVDAVSTNITVK